MKRSAALACLLCLLLTTAAAAAKPAPRGVTVGRVALAALPHGRASLLVSVSYPLAMAGRPAVLRVAVARRGGGSIPLASRPVRLSAGPPRLADRRRRFAFVHQVVLGAGAAAELRRSRRVVVSAQARLDANHDGRPELAARARVVRRLARGRAAPACATVPLLFTRARHPVSVRLPACVGVRHWRLAAAPEGGRAMLRGGSLLYVPSRRFRGTDTLELRAMPRRRRGAARAAAAPLTVPVVVKVQNTAQVVVRAMGDSVTAGFGYYSSGRLMPLVSLPECRPGSVTLVDACSSNSETLNNSAAAIEYAPDYGLANNVSWAAQWANEYGVTDYENLAISGSEPVNWAPEGSLYATTREIESEDPDYVLLTLGANPLLSEMLFGTDRMGCAIWSDLFGKYEECIEEAFEGVHLRRELERVYTDLVKRTDATIYLMQYHLSIPSTALAYTAFQIAQMGALLNREIARAAAAVNPTRLRVVTPPHFNVGIDLEPLYPSRYSCSRLGYKVDGQSVQIEATQDELLIDHPLSFCSGPAQGPPWVISGDTGIHPSAAGYAEMASQLPAPE
ncbi:MAG: GDSL-type esterase/lipase family protein [Solirubrobacterales bacterium]